MKDYDAYLFDWDGTLAQTFEILIEVARKQLKRHNLEISDREISRNVVGRFRAGLLELGVPDDAIDEAVEAARIEVQERAVAAPLYTGAREILQVLKDHNKKIVLITTNWRQVIDITIGHHDLLDLFDLVIAREDVSRHKPDPEGILFVLDKYGLEPGRALMLGDSDKDLGAAQNTGVDSLLFYPKSHQAFQDLEYLKSFKPRYVVTNWQVMLKELQ